MIADPAAELVDAGAAYLGLVIDPAHRPGVVVNMDILQSYARLFLDFVAEEVVADMHE